MTIIGDDPWDTFMMAVARAIHRYDHEAANPHVSVTVAADIIMRPLDLGDYPSRKGSSTKGEINAR
jgi:hypothetical protein